MICKICGKRIEGDVYRCPHCGVVVSVQAPNQTPTIIDVDDNKKSHLFNALSFFFPIIGIILYFVWKEEKPLKAKGCLKWSIVSIVVGAIITVLVLSLPVGLLIFLNSLA